MQQMQLASSGAMVKGRRRAETPRCNQQPTKLRLFLQIDRFSVDSAP